MQNGTVIATVSAILIGAGALLWYERDQPRYPTARDEAEARFALLERAAAYGLHDWGDAPATSTNVVGLYHSRAFWRTTLPAAVEDWRAWDGNGHTFLDLWAIGGDLSRSVTAYPNMYADEEPMGSDWWTNNMYAAASGFGDFQYLHTNTLYMSTNVLNQVGRALSAMRWTWESGVAQSNIWVDGGTTYSGVLVDWYSAWHEDASKAAALAAALADLEAQTPSDDDGVIALVGLAAVTNASVYYHYVRVTWNYTGMPDTWLVQAEEHAYFRPRKYFAPLWTNCVVYHIGGFKTYTTGANDSFWHPIYGTSLWEVAEAPAIAAEIGYEARDEVLYNWPGRIPSADIEAVTPVDESDVYGVYYIGWRPLLYQASFLVDWRFQAMTNRAAFW